MELNIVGLKLHHYIGQKLSENESELINGDLIKYILCLKDNDNKKYELEMHEEYGECHSGYTWAIWGKYNLNQVDNFGAITHVPKTGFSTKIIFNTDGDYICDWFSFSDCGCDCYYPKGYVKVEMDRFKSTMRGFNEHPTWIFYGNSNLGKSFLGNKIKEMTIFETDSHNVLPEKINTDIIVLGNKHNYTLSDIMERVDGKIITVTFNSTDVCLTP